MRGRGIVTVLLPGAAAGLGPGAAAAAVVEGRPACDYCRMIIEDRRFGGEILTTRGRRLVFDSVECTAANVVTDSFKRDEVRAIYAIDHDAPGGRLRAERASYLHSTALPSPMTMNLSAYRSAARAEAARRRHAGEVLAWTGVLRLVDRTWFPNRRPRS
jgi:copper chaperone NosL